MPEREFDDLPEELSRLIQSGTRWAATSSDGCINLIPILTHELGHAFGLAHIDNPSQPSLMDSRFSREAWTPTDQDVAAVVSILEKSITGAAPGVLEFVSSSGVQPPLDWEPPN